MRNSRKRPRGFIIYTPGCERAALITTVQGILARYQDILPITLRQLFYILVSHYGFPKTERAYKCVLVETIEPARRGRLIEMDAIRDDGFTQTSRQGWPDARQIYRALKSTVVNFTLDRQTGQERQLMLWCEAAGMVPQLQRIADNYSVQVCSSGGFDSITVKHQLGRSIADLGALEILHLGDHDPSGVHMFGCLDEDIRAFADSYGGDVKITRLAVIPEQIDEFNLPTAPPKETDRRSFAGLTTQCEAIDPRTLAKVVQDAIEARMDMNVYRHVLMKEAEEQVKLECKLKQVGLWDED